MYFYERDRCDNRWLLMSENEDYPINSFSDLSILYSDMEVEGRKLCSILKHGSSENIDKWEERNFKKYKEAGLSVPIRINVIDSVSAEDVNFLLARSCISEGYFLKLSHDPLEAIVIRPSL